jgi:RND family efflux transporter MFP subunit
MTNRSRRNAWIPFLIPLFLLAGCGGGEPVPDREPAVPVRTARVIAGTTGDGAAYAGTVEPIERVRLATKIMGRVEAIDFDEGDEVRAEQTLVRLRPREIEAKRAQAEAAVEEAEAHLRNATAQRDRIESLFDRAAATPKELDDVRTAFAGAQARRRAAGEALKEVEELLRYTSLSAPFDGVVTRRWMEPGDLAAPGQPILEVENLDRVKVVARVPEGDVGMTVRVEVLAGGQEPSGAVEGTIDRVVPSADPMSRQFDIKVHLDNPGHRIKPGMFARVIVGTPGGGGLTVPRQAVFRRGQLEGLFVVGPDGRARLRWIRTGATHGGRVEVLSGVDADEEVIVEGLDRLRDGQSVEVAR